jgi:ribosomal protein RSM22 (predicted rRNA methylase)
MNFMSIELPKVMQAAIARRLAAFGGGHREGAARLREVYRKGGSAKSDLDAYLVTRLPATYAAVAAALGELRRLAPEFAPESVLDIGAGPGTASWAAKEAWASLKSFSLADNHPPFLALARELWEGPAEFLDLDLRKTGELPKADLAIAAYTLAEMPEAEIAAAARKLWGAAKVLAIVEPGTPAGFSRIWAARDELIGQGALIVAPCPHREACPIAGPDWCHFSVRLPRSRAHMHAKKARLPFEDEKFAYLIASRTPAAKVDARVLAPPRMTKAGIGLKLCTSAGLEHRNVARRDGPAYKLARKLDWGSGF